MLEPVRARRMPEATACVADDAKPWPGILAFYSGLAERNPVFLPLARLAARLAESDFPKAGLHGLTSMHDLLLGPSPQIRANPHLRVECDLDAKRFHLTYVDGSKKPWQRTVAPDDAYEAIERMLTRRARWFRRPVPSTGGRR